MVNLAKVWLVMYTKVRIYIVFFAWSIELLEKLNYYKFAGTLLSNGMEVAMKFTPYNKRSSAEREYRIYTYLNAINNRMVECYGISSIHFYGRWENFIMMAMNLFDSEFHERTKNRTITEVDLLILFQEFVNWKFFILSENGFFFFFQTFFLSSFSIWVNR